MEDKIVREDVTLWFEHLANSGPLCLLVGGAGAISTFWPDEFCRRIHRAGYQVVRYDQRDTGNSSFVDFENKPYGLMDLVDDAMAIVDHVGAPAVHLVGHSMGGFVAQQAAICRPERVLSLTSISSHTAGPDLPPPPARTWEVMMANQPTGLFDNDLPGYLEVWRYLNGDISFDEAAAVNYTRELYRRNPATLPADNHVALQVNMRNRAEELEGLSTPALVVHGGADPLVPVVGGQRTADALVNARFLVLPEAGHMFFNELVWDELALQLINLFERAAWHDDDPATAATTG
jgi:pimeloyl-ACP methyl ester carboxylesterase